MYQTAAGQRLTLFVATNPDNRETAFRFAEENGASVFYWYDGPLGYALSGEIGRADLLPIARAVYDRLSN
jgi:anti-sigma factor RsiW